MIRKINVTHYKNKSSSLEGFIEVPISNVGEVVNFSVDVLYCAVLNMVDQDKLPDLLANLTQKIRHGGQLTLVINDIKHICQLFINKQISDEQFFGVINENKNNVSNEQIIRHVLEGGLFDLIGTEKSRSMIAISFGRKNND
jgi:hypothetical protein